jgi:putative acetyltransferase
MLTIREDDLESEPVRNLLALHLTSMHASSPVGHAFALDLGGLKAPGITVWTAWFGDELAGIAALKKLSDMRGELKSMRTQPAHLRKGVAAALLDRIIAEARRRGLTRLSLETGTGEPFEAAVALYRRRGFVEGRAFGDHRTSNFNRFFHLKL